MITSRRDRALPLHERAALRLHLLACKACPTLDRQMDLLHGAMGRWRSYMDQGERP